MKIPAYILLFIFLTQCKQVGNKKLIVNPKSKYYKLIEEYRDITFDTLNIWTAIDLEFSHDKLIDSIETELILPYKKHQNKFNDYYACSKFEIDSNNIALITRVPSYTEASSIKLLIYNTKKDSISNSIELSENENDTDSYGQYDKRTSIFRQKGKIHLFIWIENRNYNERKKDSEELFLYELSQDSINLIENKNQKLNSLKKLLLSP